jgi:hypothetical protein
MLKVSLCPSVWRPFVCKLTYLRIFFITSFPYVTGEHDDTTGEQKSYKNSANLARAGCVAMAAAGLF